MPNNALDGEIVLIRVEDNVQVAFPACDTLEHYTAFLQLPCQIYQTLATTLKVTEFINMELDRRTRIVKFQIALCIAITTLDL